MAHKKWVYKRDNNILNKPHLYIQYAMRKKTEEKTDEETQTQEEEKKDAAQKQVAVPLPHPKKKGSSKRTAFFSFKQ